MCAVNKLFVTAVLLCCAIDWCLFKKIPNYLTPCMRDQNMMDACALTGMEEAKKYLKVGVPELGVPSIDPFFIPELRKEVGELAALKAYGKAIQVTGGSDYIIKSLTVDLDTFAIRIHLLYPKLHFEGIYTVAAYLPIEKEGKLIADITNGQVKAVLHSKIEKSGRMEFIQFTSLDFDMLFKDYNIQLERISFSGDKTLGEATNQAINQNRDEFMQMIKSSLEKRLSRLLMNAANKITANMPLEGCCK